MLDLAKWDAALYTTQLLKQSSLDRIWTVSPLNNGKPNPAGYGFGWSIGEQNSRKRIEHGGAWQGFTCDISRYPDDNLAVVVLTNLDSGHSNPGLIAHVVAGMVVPPLAPAKLAAIPDDQPATAGKVARLLDQIVAGEDIRPQTTPELAALIVPATAAHVRQMLSNLWPGGTLTLVKRTNGPDSKPASTFRLSKTGGTTTLIFYKEDAAGKISGLAFGPDRDYE